MNEFVQKYLEKRNAEKREEQRKKVLKLMGMLKIGEKEYPENSDYDCNDYPYWDVEKRKYYRYNPGEMSDEEVALLLQNIPVETEHAVEPERSGWYSFATFMIVLSSIGLFVLSIVSITEENAIYFLIGLGEFFMVSLFCAVVQLLASIKLGVDKLLIKMK